MTVPIEDEEERQRLPVLPGKVMVRPVKEVLQWCSGRLKAVKEWKEEYPKIKGIGAFVGGQLAATMLYEVIALDMIYVEQAHTLAPYRRHGLMRALLDHVTGQNPGLPVEGNWHSEHMEKLADRYPVPLADRLKIKSVERAFDSTTGKIHSLASWGWSHYRASGAFVDGKMVATLLYDVSNPQTVYLHHAFTSPSFRQQGIMRSLFDQVTGQHPGVTVKGFFCAEMHRLADRHNLAQVSVPAPKTDPQPPLSCYLPTNETTPETLSLLAP